MQPFKLEVMMKAQSHAPVRKQNVNLVRVSNVNIEAETLEATNEKLVASSTLRVVGCMPTNNIPTL